MEEKSIINAYSASTAVQGLNHVDNFDPSKFLITSVKDGETRQYLETQMRTLWFRLAHPEGQVRSTIVQLTDTMAVVEARVYLNRTDSDDDFIANATAQRFASQDPTFGAKFLESAETAAAGRALGRAGFGTQFCVAPGEGEDGVVDTGVKVDSTPAEPQVMPGSTAEQPSTGQEPQSHPQAGGQASAGTQPPASAAAPAPSQPAAPNPASGQKTPPPMPTLEEILKTMTVEQALNVVISAGRNKGKTMSVLAQTDPGLLAWIVNNYRGNDNYMRASAQVLLHEAQAQNLPQVG